MATTLQRVVALEKKVADLTAQSVAHDARIEALEQGEPEPTPEPTPEPGQPAFMARPASGPIVRNGGQGIVIENLAFDGGSRDSVSGVAITVLGAVGVTIRDIDLEHLVGGILLQDCSGPLLIENVRGRNIGDGTIGSGHSNYVQLNRCRMPGTIHLCRFLGGRTEDMLSLHQSGGLDSAHKLIVEDNRLQGLMADTPTARAWTSASGTGIIIGDGPGGAFNGNTIVRRNTLLTPGQVGIQHIDGPGIETSANVIYGENHPRSNIPYGSWSGNPVGVIRGNRYYWLRAGQPVGPWFHVTPSGLVQTDNVQDASIDPASLAVTF